jgi:hypothetical protein
MRRAATLVLLLSCVVTGPALSGGRRGEIIAEVLATLAGTSVGEITIADDRPSEPWELEWSGSHLRDGRSDYWGSDCQIYARSS